MLTTIACLCLSKVNLFNALIFLVLIIALLLDRIRSIEFRIQTLFSVIIQLLVCILTIISMVYQLTFVKNTFFITTCNGTTSNETIIDPYLQKPRDNLVYIGLEKDEKIGLYLKVNFKS